MSARVPLARRASGLDLIRPYLGAKRFLARRAWATAPARASHERMQQLSPQPLPQPDLLPGSIDQYLATAVLACLPHATADDVRTSLVGAELDTADDIAVVDSVGARGRLLGLVPVVRLLAAAPLTPAADLMDSDPPVVVSGTGSERAAWKAVQHRESSLAVVDEEGYFRGLVPPARLLGVLLREHDEDFARLGGYLASSQSARAALEERLGSRLLHRLPWLALGLAGAAISAWLVNLFEGRITADVRVAFFVPGVVYLADAVGTQTEALVVRGLSVGAPMRRALGLEIITGPALGLLLAGVTLPAVWLALGDPRIAVAVAVALCAACATATVVAALLPWWLAHGGRDPAFGSGPLATVVQDLLSLAVYFVTVVLIVN